jgi:hypothetical protein
MNKRSESVVRTALLSVAATAIGVGAFLGLPRMKALAAAQEMKAMPRMAQPPVSLLNIVQPSHVNPSARKLVAIADRAVTDQAFASRIFQEPDAVAAEHNLSEHEKLVLRNMTPELFATSQGDATRIGAARLSQAGSRRLPASVTDPKLITGRMVVGRAILAAVGRSYLDAANAHACCPWGKAIELGVNPSRVFYDEVFKAPAGLNRMRPRLDNVPQPNLEAPRLEERG